MGYYLYQNFSIVIYEYNLINKIINWKKSQRSSDDLTIIFYYISRI